MTNFANFEHCSVVFLKVHVQIAIIVFVFLGGFFLKKEGASWPWLESLIYLDSLENSTLEARRKEPRDVISADPEPNLAPPVNNPVNKSSDRNN